MPRFIKLSLVETNFTTGDNGEWITKVEPNGESFVAIDHILQIKPRVDDPTCPATAPYTMVTLAAAESYITVAETPEQIMLYIERACEINDLVRS